MAEGEVVKVDEEPVGFFFGGLFYAGCVFFDIIFGGVDGFGPSVDEDVECEIEEVLYICAFLKGSDVVCLHFVACVLPVVQGKLPAQQVAAQGGWYRPLKIRFSQILYCWCCKN